MKKILKVFFIIPIFILLAFFGVACEDNSLKSISVVSITNITNASDNETTTIEPHNGYYRLNKGDVFEVAVSCNPSSYSASDFEWSSSNTYCVIVSGNVLRAINVGNATITVSYRNSNGETIKTRFDVDVNAYAPEITFRNVSNNIQYRGIDLLSEDVNNGDYSEIIKLTADQDTGSGYIYSYYDVNGRKPTTEIINAGKYKITCTKEGTNISTTKEITVLPRTVTISGGSYTYTYGAGVDDPTKPFDPSKNFWPRNLINEDNITSAINNNNVSVLKGVGCDAEKDIVKYVEYVANNVTVRSNVGSKPVYVSYQLGDEYKNNYSITVENGNLNIISRIIIILPNEQTGDSSLTYGQSIRLNSYKIYSYQTNNGEWVGAAENFKVNGYQLDDSVVDYSSNFVTNLPNYYSILVEGEGDDAVESIGEPASLNSVNCLNAGEYFYKMNFTELNSNIRIANNFSNVLNSEDNGYFYKKVEVKQKEVTVCPLANQSKVFLQNDPETILYTIEKGSFVSGDTISKFLFVNYNEVDLGENNFKAHAREYFYKIQNDNINYKITLSTLATSASETPGGGGDGDKIKFRVIPLSIYVDFDNVSDRYKVPNNDGAQTVSYVTNYVTSKLESSSIVANYKTRIKTLTIQNKTIITNGEFVTQSVFDDIVINKSSTFETDGWFEFSHTNDAYLTKFKFALTTGSPISFVNSEYFESYFLSSGIFTQLSETDYTYSYPENSIALNLSKITIKVYPNESSATMSKVYDGTNEVPGTFGVGLSTYSYDSLGIDGLILSNVLRKRSDRNPFNIYNDSMLAVELDEYGSVGSYTIILNPDVECNERYAYFNFVLDDSKEYTFSINPCTLTVTPYANQQKSYGASDPLEFSFSVKGVPVAVSELDSINEEISFNDIESRNLVRTGKLSRESGEYVNNYEITKGTLSFGDNYNVTLDSVVRTFAITKRILQITPSTYTTVYGEDYPSEIAYSVVTLNEDSDGSVSLVNANIYQYPEKKDFSGTFSLGYFDEDLGTYNIIQKIGGYYPAGDYKILQGSFDCSSNYQIRFVESDFIVQRRPTTINFRSQDRSSTDVISTTVTNVTQNYYENLNNLKSSARAVINSIELTSASGFYYVNSIEDVDIQLFVNDVDVTDSYDISLGKYIVYKIDVTVIELTLFHNGAGTPSNILEAVYNGQDRDSDYDADGNDDFVLVCQTPGYEVVVGEDKTNFSFQYLSGSTSSNKAETVGSYTVMISMGEFSKIVINNINKPEGDEDKYIEFNDVDFENQLIVNNHVLSVANVAYLNITKADLVYTQSALGFVGALQYGTTNLPDLRITDGTGRPIFKGVSSSTDTIELKRFDGVNYKLLDSIDGLKTLDASTRNPVNITIEATNTNYKPITTTVYLEVAPRNVTYSNAQFGFNSSHSVVYSGATVSTSLNLNFEEDVSFLQDKFQITYNYRRLQASYNNSPIAEIACLKSGVSSATTLNVVKNLDIASFTTNSNYVMNDIYSFPYYSGQNDIPVNAGVYVCFATCVLNENYTFVYTGGYPSFRDKIGNNLVFATLFEITKMGDGEGIVISDWKDEFKYTTEFDFTRPSTLPFEYNVYPNSLKQSVVYVHDNFNEKPVVLPVDSYTVKLKIDESNYYCEITKRFSVTQLEAQIITPSILTYIHTGNVINSFLQNIGAVLKDKDGQAEGIEYYYSNTNVFTITYYAVNGLMEETEITAEEVIDSGNYKLHIKYGVEDGEEEEITNYYGTGEYSFSIIAAPYTGTVTFKDSWLNYDPNYTAQTFFETIINNRNTFNIDLVNDEYTLSMYYVIKQEPLQLVQIVGYNDGYQYNDANFKAYFEFGTVRLRIVVSFVDTNIDDYVKEALLSIRQKTISDSNFLTYTTGINTFVYSGYRVYQDITLLSMGRDENSNVWEGRLVPETFSGGQKTVTYGGYTYTIKYQSNKYIVNDKLNNEIFTLKYDYYYNTANPSEASSYTNFNSFPIAPNQYKIRYITTVGKNYSNSFTSFLQERTYIINKVDTLYISFSPDEILYDGTDGTNGTDHYDSYWPSNLCVSNDPNINVTNMKVTPVHSDSHSYIDDDGVCLKIHFDVTSLKDVGKYKVKLTLLNNSSYVISKYFNKIKTSVLNESGLDYQTNIYDVYSTSEIQYNDFRVDSNTYREIYENWLYIKISVDVNNYQQVIKFSEQVYVMPEEPAGYLRFSRFAEIAQLTTGCNVYLCNSNKVPLMSSPLTAGYSFGSLEAGTYFLKFEAGMYCSETFIKIVIT